MKYQIKVPMSILKAVLIGASTKQDVRSYLMGINIDIKKKEFQATDGHIAVKITNDVDVEWNITNSDYDENIWIDRKILENFLKISKDTVFGNRKGVIKITISLDDDGKVTLENESRINVSFHNEMYFDGFNRLETNPIENGDFKETTFSFDSINRYGKVLKELSLHQQFVMENLYNCHGIWKFSAIGKDYTKVEFLMKGQKDNN